jgi:putative methyltransferase (TIGR04325 family)
MRPPDPIAKSYRSAVSAVAAPMRTLIDAYKYRRFERSPNAVRGVFHSFEEARASAPASQRVGYDHPELARMYDGRLSDLRAHDYPTLFWVDRLLGEGSSIFDFGGHVGVLYYGFRKHISRLASTAWRVCDVPEVIAYGKQLAVAQNAPTLSFTDRFEDGDGFDILLASGSLQYVEPSIASMVSRLTKKPRHIIVSNTPMYDGEAYVTLQNTIHSFNPYRVFNRSEFIRSLAELGYSVVDSWDAERSLTVPLHPECAVPMYPGLYFGRA